LQVILFFGSESDDFIHIRRGNTNFATGLESTVALFQYAQAITVSKMLN